MYPRSKTKVPNSLPTKVESPNIVPSIVSEKKPPRKSEVRLQVFIGDWDLDQLSYAMNLIKKTRLVVSGQVGKHPENIEAVKQTMIKLVRERSHYSRSYAERFRGNDIVEQKKAFYLLRSQGELSLISQAASISPCRTMNRQSLVW